MSDKNWWLSWWWDPDTQGSFELHTPWWRSGSDPDDRISIVAAVVAPSEDAARELILAPYDTRPESLDWRFCEERSDGWSPFGSRFRRADWMRWSDV